MVHGLGFPIGVITGGVVATQMKTFFPDYKKGKPRKGSYKFKITKEGRGYTLELYYEGNSDQHFGVFSSVAGAKKWATEYAREPVSFTGTDAGIWWSNKLKHG